jgi:hypothetical protein
VVIAQDSGNRYNESHLALNLAWLEAEHGYTASAFDHLTLSIRNYHDSGNTTVIHVPLATLAALLDRLERYQRAATIAGFALSPLAAAGSSFGVNRPVTDPELLVPSGHNARGERLAKR